MSVSNQGAKQNTPAETTATSRTANCFILTQLETYIASTGTLNMQFEHRFLDGRLENCIAILVN
jgi:hypothetical protein